MDQRRNSRAIAELIEQYYVLVYRYAYRLTGSVADAEDLTQETFLLAQANLGQLREPSRAKGWLCAIVRNEYLKHWKRRRIVDFVSLEAFGEPAGGFPVESDIDEERLQKALNQIPEEFRTTLILFYFHDFSYKEIAAHLKVPMGTVMSRLARGKTHLRRLLIDMPQGASTDAAAPALPAKP